MSGIIGFGMQGDVHAKVVDAVGRKFDTRSAAGPNPKAEIGIGVIILMVANDDIIGNDDAIRYFFSRRISRRIVARVGHRIGRRTTVIAAR